MTRRMGYYNKSLQINVSGDEFEGLLEGGWIVLPLRHGGEEIVEVAGVVMLTPTAVGALGYALDQDRERIRRMRERKGGDE